MTEAPDSGLCKQWQSREVRTGSLSRSRYALLCFRYHGGLGHGNHIDGEVGCSVLLGFFRDSLALAFQFSWLLVIEFSAVLLMLFV